MLKEFDRVVFKSVVEIIIIGGYNDEEVEDSLLALDQLGALAVYKHYRENKAEAIEHGLLKTDWELYEAAWIRLDFTEDYIRKIVVLVEEEFLR